MPRDPFGHHATSPTTLLELRFGRLAAAVEPQGVSYASGETGILGNGCSVETPRVAHDDDQILWGHVDRLLLRITPDQRHVLALAFGDAGAIAMTQVETKASRRWRAVAPLTRLAIEHGERWAARRAQRLEHAPAAERWVRALEERYGARATTAEERAIWDRMKQQAQALIDDALAAFSAACRAERAA